MNFDLAGCLEDSGLTRTTSTPLSISAKRRSVAWLRELRLGNSFWLRGFGLGDLA